MGHFDRNSKPKKLSLTKTLALFFVECISKRVFCFSSINCMLFCMQQKIVRLVDSPKDSCMHYKVAVRTNCN